MIKKYIYITIAFIFLAFSIPTSIYSSGIGGIGHSGIVSVLPASVDAVDGPSSSTNNAVARYDGTTGKLLQDSGVIIDDSDKFGVGTIPTYKLHVQDNLSAGTSRLLFENLGNAQTSYDISNSEGSFRIITDAGEFKIFDQTDNAIRIQVDTDGNIGIEIDSPTAKLHVDQSDSSGAMPVLRLDQGDIDDSFIDYIGTSAADGTRSISSDTTEDSTKFGAIRIEINGVTKWIRIYDDES